MQSNQSGEGVNELAQLPKDMAVLKMENDNIMAMASATPRNMMSIKQEMVDQLQAFPVFAQAAIYSKPVGNGKKVRGLSVRAAEALAEAYGYCRVRTFVEPVGEDGARVTASFTDFQKGRVWEDSGFLSKFYKKAGGGMARTPDDRFWNVSVKAEASRRVREVILRSVPPGMKMELQSIAEKEMAKALTDADVQKIIAGFETLHVSLAQLETFVGKTLDAGWNQDDRLDLVGAFTALKDGETTIGEMFSVSPDSPKGDRSSELNNKLGADAEPEPKKKKAAQKKKAAEPKKEEPAPVVDEAAAEAEQRVAAEPEDVTEDPNPPKQPETKKNRFPDATADQIKFHGFQVDRIMAAKSPAVLARIREPLDKAMEDGKLTGNQYTDLLNEIEEAHQNFAG